MGKKRENYYWKELEASISVHTVNHNREKKIKQLIDVILKNYDDAREEMRVCNDAITKVINTNRGGSKGMHGFIGECMQVYTCNADALVKGERARYTLLDDNGPVDYLRDNIPIQQKACKSGGVLGLDHIQVHMNNYGSFAESGIYQIPKDFYMQLEHLQNMPRCVAGKLGNEEYKLWLKIQRFKLQNPGVVIEPMNVAYDEIQVGNVSKTIEAIEKKHNQIMHRRCNEVVQMNRPNIRECIDISIFSGLFEGAIDVVVITANKLIGGKKLIDFTSSDFNDVMVSGWKGTIKGTIRGASVYAMSNTLRISTPVASAITTASFVIYEDVNDYKSSKCSKEELKENVIWDVLDVTVSVMGSIAGAKCISKFLPAQLKGGMIIGSLIGNGFANLIYKPIKNMIKK